MANGNAYPAVQLDSRGQVVDSGVVVQFTDSTDQPGSGGGGSGGVAQLFATASTPLGLLPSLSPGFPIGPGATNGNGSVSMASVPVVVAAMGQVCIIPTVGVQGIPTVADNYLVNATLWVGNAAGTETIQVDCQLVIPEGGGSGSMDWSTATPTAIVGTDLAWDGTANGVSTTLGGIFIVTLAVTSTFS